MNPRTQRLTYSWAEKLTTRLQRSARARTPSLCLEERWVSQCPSVSLSPPSRSGLAAGRPMSGLWGHSSTPTTSRFVLMNHECQSSDQWLILQVPPSAGRLSKRLYKNVDYFQSNYVMVFLVLVLYCLITSPLLIIVLAASGGACYIAGLKNAERKLSIAGD